MGLGEHAMSVRVIASEASACVGDALRVLDSQAVLKKDFILVHGDVIANIDLQSILAKHKYDDFLAKLITLVL